MPSGRRASALLHPVARESVAPSPRVAPRLVCGVLCTVVQPTRKGPQEVPAPGIKAVIRSERERRFEENYLGYHIRERDGIYIAVPLEWAHGRGETIVSTDLLTLRDEIRRWWYQVGTS